MKKRVSYTVLTIILMLAMGISGFFSYSVNSSVNRIEKTVEKLTDTVTACGNRTTRLETRQDILSSKIDRNESEIHQLRNVTQDRKR